MRVWWCLILLAGCADPATPAVRSGTPCDYQLDDYAGGTDHVQAWWSIPGEPDYPPSGKAASVTLTWQGSLVAQGTTTTDCLLIGMAGAKADFVRVRIEEGACAWSGGEHLAYDGGFEVVEITLGQSCA